MEFQYLILEEREDQVLLRETHPHKEQNRIMTEAITRNTKRRIIKMAEVKVPELAESITEGTIAQWLKQPGIRVEKGEFILN